MNFKNVPSLQRYVKKNKKKNIKELKKARLEWLHAFAKNGLSYEIEWMKIPIIQSSEDIVLMQELIFKVRPDVIIETGIAHGGSLIFYSSLLELLRNGKVIGVDIDIREHNKKAMEAHPMFKRITLIEGNSTAKTTMDKIKKEIPAGAKVLVCLDSCHEKKHVLKELELYKDFIKKGSYMVVFDTVTSELAKIGTLDGKYINNGPGEAVYDFLAKNKNFKIDKRFNRLYISTNNDGYLVRVK